MNMYVLVLWELLGSENMIFRTSATIQDFVDSTRTFYTVLE